MALWINGHAAAVLAAALLIVVGLVGAWDIYCVYGPGSQYTVSALLADWSRDWPMLPFALGAVAGHIFWGRWPTPPQAG